MRTLAIIAKKKALILRANRGITERRGPPIGGPIQRDPSF